MPWLIFLILAALSASVCAAEVNAVHGYRTAAGTRLVFDVSAPLKYSVSLGDKPPQVVVDFKGATAHRLLSLDPASTGIKYIRQFMRSELGLRVVLELAHASRVETRLLAPSTGRGYQLELVLEGEAALAPRLAAPVRAMPVRPASASLAAGAANPTSTTNLVPAPTHATPPTELPITPQPIARSQGRGTLVVAIDAGHGGPDVGAIGPSGAYEKDVVLAVARELARLIDGQPRMRAVLTRDGDYFLPLRARMDRARAKRADLFVSVHADAVNDRRVQGSSVYVLSQRGASSEAAKWLAANENAADLVGGVSLDDKDRMLKSVLLDLSQAASLDASIELGTDVLRGLHGVGRVLHTRPQNAGFMVLKSPDIPSILVETAFISNPVEEARLTSSAYRRKLAHAIFNGVVSFDAARGRRAPPAVERVMADADMPDARRHRVSPGETLSGIATRYEVSLNTLKQANDMDSEIVRAGSLLRIP